MSNKEGVDALVREYLISRGYTKTAAELEMEATTLSNETANTGSTLSNSSLVAKQLLSTVAEDLYILGLKDRSTECYFNGYDLVRSWAANSIDIVKTELLALTFPIFVHCYLGMVRLGFNENAQKFMKEFKNDHIEYHTEELQQLSSISSQEQYNHCEQIRNNSFISCCLSNKFILRISSLAYNLLSLFLVQSDLVLIASIINNKVSFKKLDDTTAAAGSGSQMEEPMLVELPGFTAGTRSSFLSEFEAIPLGVPGTIPKIQHLIGASSTTATLTAAHLTLPMTKDDEFYRSLINKIVRPKTVISSLVKRQRTTATTTDSTIQENSVIMEGQENDNLLYNADKLGAFSKASAVEVSELTSVIKEEPGVTAGGGGGSRSSKRESIGQLKKGVPLEPSVIFATVTNAYEGVVCLDMNPSLTQMVTGHRDSSVRVWRLNNKEKEPHFGRLLKASSTGREWEMKEVLPKTKRMFQEEARRSNATSTNSSSNNSNNNGTTESDSSAAVSRMLELRGHSRAVYGVSQDNSRGGEERLVLSCSADETIRLWDTAVSQCVGKYNCVSPPWAVEFSPLGYHFASANQDKTGTVYATDRVAPLRLLTGHVSDVNCVNWHDNATLLATGSDDRTARLWDVRTSHSVRLLRGCSTPISCLAISPIGNLLAAGTDNGKIYMWDLTTTRPMAVLQGHENAVHSIAFNANSTTLCSGGMDCSVRIWNIEEVIQTQTKLTTTAVTSLAHTIPSNANNAMRASSISSIFQNISKTAYLDAPQLLLRPHHSYFTKFSPVFHVGFTPENLVYAGGPFSLVAATTSGLGNSSALQGETEQDTIAALGISHAVPSSH